MSRLLLLILVCIICCESQNQHSLIGSKQRQDSYISNFRANITGIMFSGVFSNNAVLQREPYHSAIYGTCDTPNVSITLTLIDELMPNNKPSTLHTKSMLNGDWKILLPQTYPNGGNYTCTVTCHECVANPKTAIISNITFGDIYFCAGQSNMVLEMKYTFSKNYTYANITQLNKYSNIRFYTKNTLKTNDTNSYIIPNQNILYQWHQSNELYHLKDFSATCWYFAQSLVDKYQMDGINFGLIASAIGGSMIEGWIMNNTINDSCTQQIACPDTESGYNCGAIYNGMVVPFINMSIKGVLWYQGENNLFEGNGGNWRTNSGYSCLQKLMIEQWRENWSVVPNTTDKLFPFGIVQLASGTSEGYHENMASFRWAQQFNSFLPNDVVVNTFIAQSYDVGDPWARSCAERNRCKRGAPYNIEDEPWTTGPIHPRPKIYIGERLAMGANKFIYKNDEIWQGPLVTVCYLKDTHIICEFDKTMLYDEQVTLQPFKLWYNETLGNIVKQWTAFELWVDYEWKYIEDDMLNVDSDGYSVVIDVGNITDNGHSIMGVRYAWNSAPCCGDLDISMNPCPMNMCPIITSKSRLPAMPFSMDIVQIEKISHLQWNAVVVFVMGSFVCSFVCSCLWMLYVLYERMEKPRRVEDMLGGGGVFYDTYDMDSLQQIVKVAHDDEIVPNI